ncbi:MAG: ATP-dependent helicase [candidate division KSB1 bacterium]|nr:ATP-dependent helicase [candidate division KSB1 bacterium]MDZ7302622.1 ATP-dependent helicase [candidate division KSB1 bacterium]MDZ7311538.1 ATP-dependent helicase [candidate division KSB1 bacterium]
MCLEDSRGRVNYTPRQRDAISTTDQNLQIIACAGSGKTQIISARIVEILKRKKAEGIKPANIVAFTFTEKAAGELKDRIHRLCREELGSDLGLAEMFVGTIHGYCLHLLQSPPLYKFLKYSVLNEVQQRLLIDKYSKQSGLTETPLLKGGTLERWKDSKLYQQLIGIIGEGSVDLRRVPAGVKAAVQKYRKLLEEQRYLDYTTIIAEALAELRSNRTLRDKLAAELKYLVVDEYQDVNPLQEMLIRELHALGANLCVVGDDDQTIYAWRGSEVGNIVHFAKRYPDVRQIALNENFRSSTGIIHAARQIIEKNPERLPKQMASTEAQSYERGNLLALSFKNPAHEAAWIAQKIKSLHGITYKDKPEAEPRGLAFSDFAILLRSVRKDAKPIIEALAAAGIPYLVGGVNELFDTPEIKAMQAVFFFLADFSPPEQSIIDAEELARLISQAKLGLESHQISAGIRFLQEKKAKIGRQMQAELYLQRVYLDFLEQIGLREENIGGALNGTSRGEMVYYNLGKFSQVISDFEQIHFKTSPAELYPAFAKFLYHNAPDYYPEGWEEAGYAKPDAVQIMTVHKAKGMQWPVVFVPCLRKNRFPSKRHGGRTVWHVLPEESVKNAERYKGTEEDERRLFYVALTRAEKYLFCSWSPIPGNSQQQRVSPFFQELTSSQYVLTAEPQLPPPARIPAKPRQSQVALTLTFSELKYYFECPYLFKLRFLYGFNAPIDQALGYGKSLHNALVEIHAESLKGRIPDLDDIPKLVDAHLHLPFAFPAMKEDLWQAARFALSRYLREQRDTLNKLEHIEKVIELKLADGIVVNGRIDLIRRTDTNEMVIVDFKSNRRAQTEEVTQKQLHVYAVGYQQLTGKLADLIEVHNLDEGGAKREVVDERLIVTTLNTVIEAGQKLRQNHLPRLESFCDKCAGCDLLGICRERNGEWII